MTYVFRAACAALALAAAAISPAAGIAQDSAPTFPGGSSSVQEIFGAWTVACEIVDGAKYCVVAHQQLQDNGQRILAIEMRGQEDGLLGAAVLPFGLLLEAGVLLRVDDQEAESAMAFRTCLPVGCVVPLRFAATESVALQAGEVLHMAVTSADVEEALRFAVPLNGLSAALARSQGLMAG